MALEDLTRLSEGLAALVAGAAPLVAGLQANGRRVASGIIWRADAIVASEQTLPKTTEYTAILPGGTKAKAALAGRDRGTNVAVLRVQAAAATYDRADPARVGSLAVAIGSDQAGGPTARLAIVQRVGPAWHSMAGGKIDQLVVLDTRLAPHEEGGPVIDAHGRLLGMSTLGPRRRVLVIPNATIDRVIDPLLKDGRIARGWLGLALQPVELSGSESGLMVMSVSSGGPAEKAGVLQGDIVLALDGIATSTPRALAEQLAPDRVGTACALRLMRAGAVHDVQATIGPRP